jgi:ribosomal protein L32
MTDVEAVPKRRVSDESRRSTRVRLKVAIEAHGMSEPLTCQGETFVVNLHGALILTAVGLRVGMKISIHVCLTDLPHRQTRSRRGRVRRSRPTATLRD